MLRQTSPFRVLLGIAGISGVILLFLSAFPALSVRPVPTNDPRADFGMMFNLRNRGVATIRDLSSTICVNSSANMGRTERAKGSAENFGNANQPLGLSDVDQGDAVALPFQSLKPGPPGSRVDLVFIVRFQPGWWFWHEERRFRFSGTEAPDRTWIWTPMPLGGLCG